MNEKDSDEMLHLLKKIDVTLKEIQIKNARDKIVSHIDGRSLFSDFLISFLTLMLQINIALWGYKYIITTTEEIPPIAIIGTMGIAFVIINSVFKVLNNFYSLFMLSKKVKKTGLSFGYLAQPLLKYDPNNKSKEYIQSIADEMVHRWIEIGDEAKIIDEFIDKLERDNSPLKNVRPVEQNP